MIFRDPLQDGRRSGCLTRPAGRRGPPTPWRAAASTFRPGDQRRSRSKIGGTSTIVVSALLVASLAWTVGHRLGSPTTEEAKVIVADASVMRAPVRTGPPPGFEESAAAPGTPARLERTSDSYRFQLTQPDRTTPVWRCPCRPIHYVVRPAHKPPGGDAVISRAIAALSSATGLTFVDDGSTREPIVPQRDPYSPSGMGIGGRRYSLRARPLTRYRTSASTSSASPARQTASTKDGTRFFVTGSVYLDAAAARQMRRRGMSQVAQQVAEHELAHLVGLAHVNDTTQVMYPRVNACPDLRGRGPDRFGSPRPGGRAPLTSDRRCRPRRAIASSSAGNSANRSVVPVRDIRSSVCRCGQIPQQLDAIEVRFGTLTYPNRLFASNNRQRPSSANLSSTVLTAACPPIRVMCGFGRRRVMLARPCQMIMRLSAQIDATCVAGSRPA